MPFVVAQVENKERVELIMTFNAIGCRMTLQENINEVCWLTHLSTTCHVENVPQVYMEVPFSIMTYSCSDERDKNVFSFIAANSKQQFFCYVFRCKVVVSYFET